jgi:hypothetical protein
MPRSSLSRAARHGCGEGGEAINHHHPLFTVIRAAFLFTVMRGLDPRTYPFGRHDGVGAPTRVGPRVKPGGDDGENA